MKILLTGGAGDLGSVLADRLTERGDTPIKFDVRLPENNTAPIVQGSILDRKLLASSLPGIDCVVHIAAWHGIHEFQKSKDEYDFWDLNVTGTFTLLEGCARAGVSKLVFISSTSVDEWPGIYAHSKLLAEDLMRTYAARHNMQIITLRPRAFIPHWNRSVYSSFNEWAQWFWKGAVHIDDVSQATLKAIDSLQSPLKEHAILTIDGPCEFSSRELDNWDMEGPGSTFKKHFGEENFQLFLKHGLEPAKKPKVLGSSEAERVIGYKPTYGTTQFLRDLAQQE